MWLREWTTKTGITISLGLTPAFNQWFSRKSHTQGIFNWRRVLRTHILMFYLIWYEVIIGLKWPICPYFMFIKARNCLFAKFTTDDFMVQVRSPPPNYVYGCHMTLVTRGDLGYVSYQKGIIQRHLVHRYASKRSPAPCSRIVFWTVLFVSTKLFSSITFP